jgi:hypothetical protein
VILRTRFTQTKAGLPPLPRRHKPGALEAMLGKLHLLNSFFLQAVTTPSHSTCIKIADKIAFYATSPTQSQRVRCVRISAIGFHSFVLGTLFRDFITHHPLIRAREEVRRRGTFKYFAKYYVASERNRRMTEVCLQYVGKQGLSPPP